jgi:hypothetical protein
MRRSISAEEYGSQFASDARYICAREFGCVSMASRKHLVSGGYSVELVIVAFAL